MSIIRDNNSGDAVEYLEKYIQFTNCSKRIHLNFIDKSVKMSIIRDNNSGDAVEYLDNRILHNTQIP